MGLRKSCIVLEVCGSWTKLRGDDLEKCILRNAKAFGYKRGKGMGLNQPVLVAIE